MGLAARGLGSEQDLALLNGDPHTLNLYLF